MRSTNITREEMWAKQNISESDIDYRIWERDKSVLLQMSKLTRDCTFVVDVYLCRYAFASVHFVNFFGYDSNKIATLEHQGDYLESHIHPDDLTQIKTLQVKLGHFMYSLPPDQRNDYCNIYRFRVRNAQRQYIQVVSKHQVLEQDRNGKAWLILGNMSITPKQNASDQVECMVLNLKNGKLFSPALLSASQGNLTHREIEILQLIQRGFLSKEIANKLGISIHTVNIHRQNLLHKLEVQNSIEAINKGLELGVLNI